MFFYTYFHHLMLMSQHLESKQWLGAGKFFCLLLNKLHDHCSLADGFVNSKLVSGPCRCHFRMLWRAHRSSAGSLVYRCHFSSKVNWFNRMCDIFQNTGCVYLTWALETYWCTRLPVLRHFTCTHGQFSFFLACVSVSHTNLKTVNVLLVHTVRTQSRLHQSTA